MFTQLRVGLDRRVLFVALAPVALWFFLLLAFDRAFWSLVTDDSFYYWQIGRNLARGLGSTFDGLNPTNGYHPLWMAFCASLYGLGLGGEVAPRVAVLVQVLIFGGAWWILSASVVRVLREVSSSFQGLLESAALGVLLVVGCAHPAVKVWVNGLESAFVLLAQVALVSVALRTERLLSPDGRRARLLMGVLIAFAFLSRTDGALMMPAIVVWSLPALRSYPRKVTVWLLEWLLLPSLIVLLYMFFNQAAFGSAIQVSGLLKVAPLEPWRIVGALAVVALPVLLFRTSSRERWPRLTLVLSRTGFFGVFCLLLLAYYGFLQSFPRVWYLGPILLYATLLGSVVLADLFALAAQERSEKRPAHAVRPFSVAFALMGLGLFCFGVVQAVTAPAAAPLLANREAGRFIARALPAEAILASWDAGVLGCYSERRLVNLDGVVNSAAYVEAMRTRTTADYLAEIPIGWVVNHSDDEARLREHVVDYLGLRAATMTVTQSWPFEVVAGVNQAVPQVFRARAYLIALGE